MTSKWVSTLVRYMISFFGSCWILTGCAETTRIVPIIPLPLPISTPTKELDLSISNYPCLFEQDVIIVVGGNAFQVELESAQIISAG